MKKWIIAAVAIALWAAFINDVGRFMTTSYYLENTTRTLAETAATAARRDRADPHSGWPATAAAAKAAGVEVAGYAQEDQVVVVVATAPVTGTWAAGPFQALTHGKPWNTPFVATSRQQAFYH